MILKENLMAVLEEQNGNPLPVNFISRMDNAITHPSLITVLSGVRRSGKSTLLYEKLRSLKLKSFINFEDPRLKDFDFNDFFRLEQIFNEEKAQTYFFDEIQNVDEWERYIRSAHDRGKKIILTGSNASLLSRELGNRLTGRYQQKKVYPFSFIEYLKFKKLKASVVTFGKYLIDGGFPEYLKNKNDDYLRTLLSDIVIRDIVGHRKIKNEKQIIRLSVYLLSNIAKEFSFNNLSKVLGIKSVRTCIDYCDYLSESYLIEMLTQFSYSPKKQINNPKKIYCVDTALARANSLSLSPDWGRYLENAVFIELRRRNYFLYFYKDHANECDFLVKEKNHFPFVIQVCWEINNDNLKREMDGLQKAMTVTNAKKGIIISNHQSDKINGVEIIPAWKWFLNSKR